MVLDTLARVVRTLAKYNPNIRVSEDTKRIQEASIVPLTDNSLDVESSVLAPLSKTSTLFLILAAATSAYRLLNMPIVLDTTFFKEDESNTFQPVGSNWSLLYADGWYISGRTTIDTVSIGDVVYEGQIIGLANDESGQFAADKSLDGTFGLAFPGLSITGAKKSPVQLMYEQKQIDEPVVGVWLGRAREGGGGEMVFGGTNPDHYTDDFIYVKVNNARYWQVSFDSVSVGQSKLPIKAQNAIIDTGTTLIVTPADIVRHVHSNIKGSLFTLHSG
ncbi:hypothetical protein Unana1_06243 [Umbelopsis nana]